MRQTKWDNLSERWRDYFLSQLYLAQGMSKDANTKVGAIIINLDDKVVVSSGYNGLPRSVIDKEERLQRPLKYNYTLHAEVNCILTALRHSTSVDNLCIATTLAPCCHCTAMIIQSGIKEVVCPPFDLSHISCGDGYKASLEMLEEAGVVVTILN